MLTHDALRVSKFALDLARVFMQEMEWLPGIGMNPLNGNLGNPSDQNDAGRFVSSAIAGVFANASGELPLDDMIKYPNEKKAAMDRAGPGLTQKTNDLTTRIVNLPSIQQLAKQIGTDCLWSMDVMQAMLDTAGKKGMFRGFPGGRRRMVLEFTGRRINRMYSAYSHSSMASLALGPAVMRQATFVAKMKDLGWLEPGRWDVGQGKSIFLLQRSAARYRRCCRS